MEKKDFEAAKREYTAAAVGLISSKSWNVCENAGGLAFSREASGGRQT
jgi:hypothetical protein